MSNLSEGYANEPVRGLPGHLPPGEHIIWQGSPDWKRLALTAFHVRGVGFYFGLLVAWAIVAGASMTGVVATLVAAAASVLLLGGIAWLSARSTIYTLTNKRIVLRIGIALPTCINVPLKIVENASIRLHPDGTADMPLELRGPTRMGWMMLWPHARPWKLGTPEPMLRSVPDGKAVAAMVSRALAAAVPEGRRVAVADTETAPKPIAGAQAA